MGRSVGAVCYINQENRRLTRFLIFVIAVVGLAVIVSGFIFTQIAWVLLICFFYLLALELILIFSAD